MTFLKTYLDECIAKLSGNVIAALNWVMTICAALTLSEWLDLSQKWVTFIVTVVVGLLSARHYVLKNRKLQKEITLKDQEIYRAIAENNKKTRQ